MTEEQSERVKDLLRVVAVNRERTAELAKRRKLRDDLIEHGLELLLSAAEKAVEALGSVEGVDVGDLWEKAKKHL